MRLLQLFFMLLGFTICNVKTDAQTLSWVYSEGSVNEEASYCVKTDLNNRIVYCGYFDATNPFWNEKLNCFNHDGFIKKIDSDGNPKWAVRFGGNSSDVCNAICIDKKNNVIGVGEMQGDAVFGNDTLLSSAANSYFVTKLDSNGNFIWTINQNVLSGNSKAFYVCSDNSENLYVVGLFTGQIKLGDIILTSKGFDDGFVLKVSPDGNVIWAKQFGGISWDNASWVTINNLGQLFITGYFNKTLYYNNSDSIMSSGKADILVASLDTAGNFLWIKAFGGTEEDYGSSITVNDSNHVFVTGYFKGQADFEMYTINSAGLYDFFITRLDLVSGTVNWVKQFGGSDVDFAFSIENFSNSGILLAGSFTDSININNEILTSNGLQDVIFLNCSNDGNVQWTSTFGGTSDDFGYSIAGNDLSAIYLTGSFAGSINMTNSTISSMGDKDIYLTAFNFTPLLNKQKQIFNTICFPIPVHHRCFLQFNNDESEVNIKILDVNGKTVFKDQKFIVSNKVELDFSDITNGIYIIEVVGKNNYSFKVPVVH